MSLINILVPYGQIGIGIGLILGLLTRFSAAMGTLMMVLFFFAAWDFEFGIVNQHLTYALVTFVLGYLGTGNFFGLDGMLAERVGPGWFRRYFMSGNPYPVYERLQPHLPCRRDALTVPRGRWRPETGAIGLSASVSALSRLGPCSRS